MGKCVLNKWIFVCLFVFQSLWGQKTLLGPQSEGNKPFYKMWWFFQANVHLQCALCTEYYTCHVRSSAGLSCCQPRLRSFPFHVRQMLCSSHERWAVTFLCVLNFFFKVQYSCNLLLWLLDNLSCWKALQANWYPWERSDGCAVDGELNWPSAAELQS